jgi:hypothetical protein
MSDDELADLDELITRAEKRRLRIIHDHVMAAIGSASPWNRRELQYA